MAGKGVFWCALQASFLRPQLRHRDIPKYRKQFHLSNTLLRSHMPAPHRHPTPEEWTPEHIKCTWGELFGREVERLPLIPGYRTAFVDGPSRRGWGGGRTPWKGPWPSAAQSSHCHSLTGWLGTAGGKGRVEGSDRDVLISGLTLTVCLWGYNLTFQKWFPRWWKSRCGNSMRKVFAKYLAHECNKWLSLLFSLIASVLLIINCCY